MATSRRQVSPEKMELYIEDLPKLRPSDRNQLAEAIAEFIRIRTQEGGRDKNNRKFAKYSEAYKESDAFAIGGKSSKVDLTLTGDMLASLDVTDVTPNRITIAMDEDETGKAYGNISGEYGQDRKVAAKRDFFGIAQKDLNMLVKQYQAIKEEDKKATTGSILDEVFTIWASTKKTIGVEKK